jgi:HK97 family phage portal protein
MMGDSFTKSAMIVSPRSGVLYPDKLAGDLLEKQNPIGPLTVESGEADQYPRDPLTSYLMVQTLDVWCYACVRAYAEFIGSVPFYPQQLTTVDGEPEWQEIDNESNPVHKLVNDPNPDESFTHLTKRQTWALMGTGNSYWLYEPTDIELWYGRPDWFKVQCDSLGRRTHYNVTNNGIKRLLEADNVAHIRLPNPRGEWYGSPPAKSIKDQILTKLGLQNYLKNYFENGIFPGAWLETDQSLSEDQRRIVKKELRRLHGGSLAKNSWNIGIGESGTKLTVMDHHIQSLMPVDLYNYIREETLAAFGLTEIMVGVDKDASYATAEAQKRVFVENSGLPILALIEDELNRQIIRTKFGPQYRIHGDRSAIPALADNKIEVSTTAVSEYRAGIITLNEARERIGEDPVDAGDEFYAPNADLFGFGDGGGDQEDSEGDKRAGVVASKAGASPHADAQAMHEKIVTAAEKRMVLLLRRFFDGQQDRIIDNLRSYTDSGKFMSRLRVFSKADVDSSDVDFIFDMKLERDELDKVAVPFIGSTVRKSGSAALQEINVSTGFNVNNPKVKQAMNGFINRFRKINDTTYDEIKALLAEGYQNGYSIDQIERMLREDIFEGARKFRTVRIAKTEMNGMVNGGAYLAHEQSGVVDGKQWVSAHLPKSRETHLQAEAATAQAPVAFSEPFEVGGYSLMYPGDPSGPAHEVINCHCRYIPVLKE